MHTQNIHSKAFTPLWRHTTHCKDNVSTYPTLPSSSGICCDSRSLRASFLFNERGFGSIRCSLAAVLQSDHPLKTNIWENHPPLIHKTSTEDFHQGQRKQEKNWEAQSSLRDWCLSNKTGIQDWTARWEALEGRDVHEGQAQGKQEMDGRSKGWSQGVYWGTISEDITISPAFSLRFLGRVRVDGEREDMQREFQDIP